MVTQVASFCERGNYCHIFELALQNEQVPSDEEIFQHGLSIKARSQYGTGCWIYITNLWPVGYGNAVRPLRQYHEFRPGEECEGVYSWLKEIPGNLVTSEDFRLFHINNVMDQLRTRLVDSDNPQS